MMTATWFAVTGCAPTSRTVSGEKGANARKEAKRKQMAPSVPFETDDAGNVVVNLDRCPALDDDHTAVTVEKTALSRPIILTHLTGNIYYALDSRCGHDSCTAIATLDGIFCPCDSTQYDFSGAAVKGSGGIPLRELPSLLNGSAIVITVN